MSKYKLDVYYLRKKLREYETLYKNIDFSKLRDRDFEIINVIDNYKFLLGNYNLKKQHTDTLKTWDSCDEDDDFFDDLEEDDDFFDDFNDEELFRAGFFYNIDSALKDVDFYTSMLYKQFQMFKTDDLFQIEPIIFNNDELMALTDKIISGTKNKDFIYYYEQVKKRTKYHVQYYDKNFYESGECLYNPIDFLFYHFLIRENSLTDILVFTHEAFHSAIYYYLAKIDKSNYAYKSNYIKEVEGFLANMIVVDYLSSFTSSTNLLRSDIHDILCYSKNMVVGMLASKSLNKDGDIDINKVNKYLLKNGIISPEITIDYIYDFIKTPYVESSSYCCSFLCACDLFHLYQSDREKAMYELLEISKLTPDNFLNNLRKHSITFMDDNFSNFSDLNNKLFQKKKS